MTKINELPLSEWVKNKLAQFKDDPEFIAESKLLESEERMAVERLLAFREGLSKGIAGEKARIVAKLRENGVNIWADCIEKE